MLKEPRSGSKHFGVRFNSPTLSDNLALVRFSVGISPRLAAGA